MYKYLAGLNSLREKLSAPLCRNALNLSIVDDTIKNNV